MGRAPGSGDLVHDADFGGGRFTTGGVRGAPKAGGAGTGAPYGGGGQAGADVGGGPRLVKLNSVR